MKVGEIHENCKKEEKSEGIKEIKREKQTMTIIMFIFWQLYIN